jgi:capsular exopolysaccharide synthesis family protein
MSQEGTIDEGRGARIVPASPAGAPVRAPYGQLLPYGQAEAPDTGGINLLEYWRILNKRKWLIISIVVAFVVLGTLRTLMMTPLYTSTVRLQIDRNVAKIVEGGNVTPVEGQYDVEFLRTQYELLQSRQMLERVASSLRLGDDKEFLKADQFSILGSIMSLFASSDRREPTKSDREIAAVGTMMVNRTVRPIPGSRLVDVSYTDPVPARAQKIVTAFADAFMAFNIDKRFQANAYAKTFLEDQLKQLKLRLEESEKVMIDFQQKEQIVAVTEKSSIAENNLAAANVALGKLVSERIENEERWRQATAVNAINLPQILSNKAVEGLRQKRNELAAEYEQNLEVFKPAYPMMVQLSNKIKELDRQLNIEVKAIRDSLKGAYDSSVAQETEVRKQIDSLKTEVLDLQKRSIQYTILKREVDTTRSLYEGLLQRYKEVDVAAGVGANNVFIVDRAQIPTLPSSPRLSRNVLLAFALGLGCALGSAFLLERLDDTVRTAEEAEQLTGLATLGVIPRVGSDKLLEEEIADPRSGLAESYRSLCTALQFSTESGLPKTLLITSAGPSEGKSITSLAIARHFANIGLKVMLVDVDLRNPSLHEKLGLDNSSGLSNCLTGACTPPEVLQQTDLPNLAFMASGPLPPNAADLLGSSRLLTLLSGGTEVFNLIVLDAPPVMGLADAPLLSSVAAATAFVVASGQARRGIVRGALKRLQMSRAPLIGMVLTKFDSRAAGYGYGYGYGYGGYGIAADRGRQLTGAKEPA